MSPSSRPGNQEVSCRAGCQQRTGTSPPGLKDGELHHLQRPRTTALTSVSGPLPRAERRRRPGGAGTVGLSGAGRGAARPGAPLTFSRRILLIQSLPRDVYRSEGCETEAAERAVCLTDEALGPHPALQARLSPGPINEWLGRSSPARFCRVTRRLRSLCSRRS